MIESSNKVSTSNISAFVCDDISALLVQNLIFEGKVENFNTFLPKRAYTLGIADVPYKFKAPQPTMMLEHIKWLLKHSRK